MKTAILLVCALAAAAVAAPHQTRTTRLDPALSDHVRVAEEAWAAAEAETDLEKQFALWETAATAFTEVDGDANVKREAKRAAAAAWSNAAETATQLLDAYNRAAQYDKMLAFVDTLAKDVKLLEGRDELASVVHKIQHQGARKRAESLTGDDAGNAFVALYNAAPEARDGDELLYNAGVSFETGHSVARALEMFALLQKHYPTGKLAARALARQGKLYGEIAFYDKAADKLEEYAKKYAGEKDAYDAISDAVYFRKALGDRAKAIEDTNYFVKTYGTKQLRAAADAMWSLTGVYEAEPDAALAHLREYLHTYGAKGGAERVVIANAKIGQILWKQSCGTPLVDGLCVKANAHAACGSATARTLATVARDPRKVREAQAAFAAARTEFERQRTDDPAARYFYAQVRLAQADGELETYLAIARPTDAGKQRAWIEDKQHAGATASRSYEQVLMAKDAATSIGAAERIAIISQSFASTLVTTKVDRACAAMPELAEPLQARAVEAFEVCLAKSTELGWWDAASTRCERELVRLRPDEFPRAIELRSPPQFAAPILDVEPPAP